MNYCERRRPSAIRFVWLLFATFAILTVSVPAQAGGLDVTSTTSPTHDDPLAMMTAESYLANAGFFATTSADDYVSFAIGSSDPGFNSVLDASPSARNIAAARRTAAGAPAYAIMRLDAGPMTSSNGFALRIANRLGQLSTVRVAWSPTVVPANPALAGDKTVRQSTPFTGLSYYTGDDDEAARRFVHLVREVGAVHRFTVDLGSAAQSNRLEFSAQLNSHQSGGKFMQQSPVALGMTFVGGSGYSLTVNPSPVDDNQAVERLRLTLGRPASSSRLTLHNIIWRRTSVASVLPTVDSADVISQGSMWTLAESLRLSSSLNVSGAVARWTAGSASGTCSMITGECRSSHNDAYGIGLFDGGGTVAPFASYARAFGRTGRLFVSVGAPLNMQTRAPLALRYVGGL